MPEHDMKAKDVQTRCSHSAEAQGRDDPQLHRPQQEVSILDDLVGEEASLSAVRGGARRFHETIELGGSGIYLQFEVSIKDFSPRNNNAMRIQL